jgi:hypothetical protein
MDRAIKWLFWEVRTYKVAGWVKFIGMIAIG